MLIPDPAPILPAGQIEQTVAPPGEPAKYPGSQYLQAFSVIAPLTVEILPAIHDEQAPSCILPLPALYFPGVHRAHTDLPVAPL